VRSERTRIENKTQTYWRGSHVNNNIFNILINAYTFARFFRLLSSYYFHPCSDFLVLYLTSSPYLSILIKRKSIFCAVIAHYILTEQTFFVTQKYLEYLSTNRKDRQKTTLRRRGE
jgi:hypothetical protein